jgi:putative Mg2+ transporter-C (MgtC) family protein
MTSMFDAAALGPQLELAARLLLAALLGAVIGLERELHGHPAGMRTHLLVCFGSAMFAVLSFAGFPAAPGTDADGPTDPTRIAAQIVSGIGFLGAGAIIKYGTSIRGLTTAGSLWATAAIGMAAASGQGVLAVVGWAIVMFCLWPLNRIAERLQSPESDALRIRLRLRGLGPLEAITRELLRLRVEIVGLRSELGAPDEYEIELDVRPQPGTRAERLVANLLAIPDVELADARG